MHLIRILISIPPKTSCLHISLELHVDQFTIANAAWNFKAVESELNDEVMCQSRYQQAWGWVGFLLPYGYTAIVVVQHTEWFYCQGAMCDFVTYNKIFNSQGIKNIGHLFHVEASLRSIFKVNLCTNNIRKNILEKRETLKWIFEQ